MKTKKKILVLGGSGFLGFNLIQKLVKKKNYQIYSLSSRKKNFNKKIYNVKYFYCDISKFSNLKKIINRNFNIIINLSGNIDHKKNIETKKVHFEGLKNLLKLVDQKSLELFIQIGSSLEYGKKLSPQKERLFCNPISYYGKAKYKASLFVKKHLKNFVILRPYQIFGPHQKNNRLIPMTIMACLNNLNFPCTSGNQLRDFLYVDDFSDLIIKIIKKKNFKHRIYNVGNGKSIKVKTVINLIHKIIHKGKPLFGRIKMRTDELKTLYPDISRIKKEFNWKPKVSLKKGLKNTISYYEKR